MNLRIDTALAPEAVEVLVVVSLTSSTGYEETERERILILRWGEVR